MVRAEILGVIAYAVDKCESVSSLQEMLVLLEGGDEEANFFNNVLYIQVYQRSRALRRLADHCAKQGGAKHYGRGDFRVTGRKLHCLYHIR